MIKAVLIDDEADARFVLQSMLKTYFDSEVQVMNQADDVNAGIEIIDGLKPDVVFLDIRMREGTGFDVLEKVNWKDFEVVFVTAFDQYAVKAFQFSAMGYLMKPVRLKELRRVISMLKEKNEKTKHSAGTRLKVLIDNYGVDKKIHKLVIPNVEGFKVVSIDKIIRLEGERNYTDFILLSGKKITSSKTLGDYQDLLSDFGFFRAHQSTIVNLRYVAGYNKGERLIEMIDGSNIALSRHRKNEFIDKFF